MSKDSGAAAAEEGNRDLGSALVCGNSQLLHQFALSLLIIALLLTKKSPPALPGARHLHKDHSVGSPELTLAAPAITAATALPSPAEARVVWLATMFAIDSAPGGGVDGATYRAWVNSVSRSGMDAIIIGEVLFPAGHRIELR